MEKIKFIDKEAPFLDANNLNKMQDNAEKAINEKVTKVPGLGLSQENFTTILKEKLNNLSVDLQQGSLKDASYAASTGILTFTKNDNSTITIDLPLELLIESGRLDSETNEIVLVLANKQEIRIPIGALITEIETKLNKNIEQTTANTTSISEITKEQTTQNEKIATNTNKNIEQDKELESIKSNLINLSTDKAEEIQVNDSSDLNARISVYGNTKQESTKGYNLLDTLSAKPKYVEEGKKFNVLSNGLWQMDKFSDYAEITFNPITLEPRRIYYI